MSPRTDSLQGSISAAALLVRRRALLSILLLGGGVAGLVLLGAWLLGSAWPRPTPLPLLLDALLLGGGAAGALYWRRVLRGRIGRSQVAAAAERRLGLDWGSLRGVLELDEALPPGTSAALARRAEHRLHERTRQHSVPELAGDLGERWHRRLRLLAAGAGAMALLLAVLAFHSPERTAAGWAPLLHPVRQLSPAPLPALVVEPGDAGVPRGEALTVRVRAAGREAVVLKWRLEGDVVHERLLPVRNDSAAGLTGPVVAPGSYWVEAPDGASSLRYVLTPVDALLLSELSIDLVYPAYLSRASDHYDGEAPPLEVPAGTTVRLAGRATRPLAAAALRGARAQVPLRVSGERFHGAWVPRESGRYGWVLRDTEGAGPAVSPAELDITVLADGAPTVALTFPGVDTVLPPDLRQPLTADAQDDHAILGAALVSWRVRSGGGEDPPVTTQLPLPQTGERVLLNAVLDASGRALAPGDTLKYFLRVRDAAQAGVSATYALRVPSVEERRTKARAEAREAIEQAERLGERTAELQRRTRNSDRNARAANARRGSSGSGGEAGQQQGSAELRFEETEDARRVLAEQQRVLEEVERLREALAGMRESMAAAGLRDDELQRRMEELEQLMERLATPELRQELEALQRALQQLDPAELQQVLERLAVQQQDLKEQLDRALALMREAAAAQELAALAQEVRELATQQRALAEAHAEQQSADSSSAEQQQELAARADSLQQQLQEMEQELRAQESTAAADETKAASARVSAAQDSMKQAAANAAGNQGERAAQQGRAAAEQLERAAEALEGARKAAAEQREQEATESLQQATRDALALAQQQQELQQQMEQARQQPGDQSARPGGEEQSNNRPGRQASPQQGSQQRGQEAEKAGGQQQGPARGSSQAGKQGGGGAQGQPGATDLGQLKAQQAAIQQGLEQLGRNLSEAGEETGAVSREVAAALNRAHTSMQQTQRALARAEEAGQLPAEQAGQTVDALNRLALSLLQQAQQMGAEVGGGLEQARQQLADAAQQQGSISGQANSLLSLSLSPGAQSDQVRRLGREQLELARRLGGMNNMLGGREDLTGEVDLLAREAQSLARELDGGRLAPEVVARQQRLFHRLLDAGRSLEQEEVSDERTAERPGAVPPGSPAAVSHQLLNAGPRYRAPTPAELRFLPPAYRQLILEYFERLNRPQPPEPERGR